MEIHLTVHCQPLCDWQNPNHGKDGRSLEGRPQKRHHRVSVNSAVLGKRIVQEQRHRLVAAQTFHLESP